MNLQQQEADRLNKELLEQRAELALLRSALESKEKVRLDVNYPGSVSNETSSATIRPHSLFLSPAHAVSTTSSLLSNMQM